MQSIPLAVLKLFFSQHHASQKLLHAIHTACGIETPILITGSLSVAELHAIHTACGIETVSGGIKNYWMSHCMQSIPLAVLKR